MARRSVSLCRCRRTDGHPLLPLSARSDSPVVGAAELRGLKMQPSGSRAYLRGQLGVLDGLRQSDPLSAGACSVGELCVGSPPRPNTRLNLESDAKVPARLGADNQGATDQMLSHSLEFIELSTVPSGHFPVEIANDIAVYQYRNACRLAGIANHECGKVSIELVRPWPGSGGCCAQWILESACTDDGGNFCASTPAVHAPMVEVGQVSHARVFEFGRRERTEIRAHYAHLRWDADTGRRPCQESSPTSSSAAPRAGRVRIIVCCSAAGLAQLA